jgi:hypothetical protein
MIDSVFISKLWRKGLGTQICTISGLHGYGIKTISFEEESVEYKNFLILQQYFNLDIDISLDNKNYFQLHPDDFFKIYTNYIIKSPSQKKAKYIALSFYNDAEIMETESSCYPYYKQYKFDEYQKIIKYIKSIGYDIITIDSRDTELISKLYILDNLVEAVISYEGGIAHLSHCLEIPVFLLPWRIKQNIYLEELLHLDRRTYFLSNINELLNFDKCQFEKILSDLKLQKGNNKLLDKSVKLKTKGEQYFIGKNKITLPFDESERRFFSMINNK